MPRSLALSLRNVYETLAISWPTVVDAARGVITVERCNERLASWSGAVVRNARMNVEVSGREHVDTSRTYVVMSNHQSHYDIPVLFHVLGSNLRMVAKAELFKVPIWGQAMLAAGFIRIDRSDREQAVESLRAGSAMLDRGTRIWIAPEGTRSPDGALGEFKSGGFRMALESRTRILPVAIDGTRRILPAKGFVVHKGQRVRVTLLPPIDPGRYGMERRKALMNDVRQSIAQALGQEPAQPRVEQNPEWQ